MFKRWLRSVLRSMLLRTFRLIADPYRHPLSRFQRSETNYFLSASVTLATVPPVSCTSSSNVKAEHRIRRTGRGPDLIEATQVFIDDDEHRFGVPDRRYASDGEASAVANKVGVGAFNCFT